MHIYEGSALCSDFQKDVINGYMVGNAYFTAMGPRQVKNVYEQ